MISTPDSASSYLQLQGLGALKGAARDGAPEALKTVARQFEGVFLQMLLKSMRSAGHGDGGLLDSDQTRFYRDLSDQQLGLSLAEGGSLGIADMLVRQLGGEGDPRPPVSAPASVPVAALAVRARLQTTSPEDGDGARPVPAAPAPETPRSAAAPGTPAGFAREVWTHAQAAARKLGVDPAVLVAQAALESGWGRAVPRMEGGRSSHNLFGIKADRSWTGPRAVNGTLEFEGGLPSRRMDAFRAYGSWAESFQDYAEFVRSNPRYREALAQAGDSRAYIRALHRAGYATDPDYARKVERILEGSTLGALRQATSVAASPLTKDGAPAGARGT